MSLFNDIPDPIEIPKIPNTFIPTPAPVSIVNPDKFANIWDWSILKGCFGNDNCRPGDIDSAVDSITGEPFYIPGVMERNFHILYLETKEPDAEISLGQYRFFRNASIINATTLFIWGPRNIPQIVMHLKDGKEKWYDPGDLPILRQLCMDWWYMANHTAFPFPLPDLPPLPDRYRR